MSITYREIIQLGAAYESKTLSAKLFNESGVQQGDTISSGFTELGSGDYSFSTSLDDTFSGYIRYYADSVYVAVSDYISASALASETAESVTSVSEVKNYLRIDTSADDDLIQDLIYAAQGEIESYVDIQANTLVYLYSNALNARQQYITKLALWQIVGDMYEHRESTTLFSVNENKHTTALLNLIRYREDSYT